MTAISATGGEKVYFETRMGGDSVSASVMDGEFMYVIDHTSEMVIKMGLAHMISAFEGEEMVMKVVEVSGSVDDSLFEIPKDCTLMEMQRDHPVDLHDSCPTNQTKIVR